MRKFWLQPGTAFKAVDHWHSEIAEHIGASCMFVHEEGQEAPELLSVSAVAVSRVPCLVIFVRDGTWKALRIPNLPNISEVSSCSSTGLRGSQRCTYESYNTALLKSSWPTLSSNDSLAQSLPRVKFPQPVPSIVLPPAVQGTDDTHAQTPPPERAKQGKGSVGKPRDMSQVSSYWSSNQTWNWVKLSGSTCCYRATMIQDAHGFLSGHMGRRDRLHQQIPTCSLPQSSDEKHSHVPMLASHGLLVPHFSTWYGRPTCLHCHCCLAGWIYHLTQLHVGIQKSRQLLTQICSDQEMEARLNWTNLVNFLCPWRCAGREWKKSPVVNLSFIAFISS